MIIDVKAIQAISSAKEFIDLAHKTTAIPALIILFAFIFLLWFIVGSIMVTNKTKFYTMFALVFILSLILLLILIFIPGITQMINNIFT